MTPGMATAVVNGGFTRKAPRSYSRSRELKARESYLTRRSGGQRPDSSTSSSYLISKEYSYCRSRIDTGIYGRSRAYTREGMKL